MLQGYAIPKLQTSHKCNDNSEASAVWTAFTLQATLKLGSQKDFRGNNAPIALQSVLFNFSGGCVGKARPDEGWVVKQQWGTQPGISNMHVALAMKADEITELHGFACHLPSRFSHWLTCLTQPARGRGWKIQSIQTDSTASLRTSLNYTGLAFPLTLLIRRLDSLDTTPYSIVSLLRPILWILVCCYFYVTRYALPLHLHVLVRVKDWKMPCLYYDLWSKSSYELSSTSSKVAGLTLWTTPGASTHVIALLKSLHTHSTFRQCAALLRHWP